MNNTYDNEIFEEISKCLNERNQLSKQDREYIANLLERVKQECLLKSLTVPKALLSENNPTSVNAYLSA